MNARRLNLWIAIRTRGSEQFRVPIRSSHEEEEGPGDVELVIICSSFFSIRASVTAGVVAAATAEGGRGRGESCGEIEMSSPV